MLELVTLLSTAFAVSAALVFLCRNAARHYSFVVRPTENRWHRSPTPALGGVAIAATVLVWSGVSGDIVQTWALVVGGAAIFAVGFVDDVVSLKPYSKLIAEIAIASMFVFLGYRLNWSESLTLDALLTLVWIVGLPNAFNLLDNMDGLSAGIALIAGFTLLANGLLGLGVTPETRHLLALLGATAGFLVFNLHPASMFLGDSGSLFIGLNLAVLTLTPITGEASSNMLSIVVGPVLILLIPIVDTTLVTVSRILSGRSAVDGGRDHSSHRLVAIGLSERAAVAVLWTLAALSGLLGIAIRNFANDGTGIVVALFLIGMIIFMVYLAHVRVYDDADRVSLEGGRFTPFATELMYKRRIAEVLLDLCLVSIGYYSAYRLRFEGAQWGVGFKSFIASLPIVVGLQMVALFVVGAYRGVWRYFGLMDAVVVARGVALGTFASVGVFVYMYGFTNFSRAVFVIYAAILTLLLSGSRASFRLIGEFVLRRRETGRRLVIYGAGGGGSITIRELLNGGLGDLRMLGFVDDDPRKSRTRMQGYPVLGGYDALESLIAGGAVDVVVVSTTSIELDRLRQLQALCEEFHVVLWRSRFELQDLAVATQRSAARTV